MTTRARVEFDPVGHGLRLAVQRDHGGQTRQLVTFKPTVTTYEPDGSEPAANGWTPLDEDDARAIYEALADYFGHSGHDTRALRRDYDSERGRVDLLIKHLTKGSTY